MPKKVNKNVKRMGQTKVVPFKTEILYTKQLFVNLNGLIKAYNGAKVWDKKQMEVKAQKSV